MKRILALILALLIVVGTFAACSENDDKEQSKENDETVKNEQVLNKNESSNIGNADSGENSNNENVNNSNSSNSNANQVVDRYAHSDIYNRIKQKWSSIWNSDPGGLIEKNEFITKAAPYTFLEEQRVVYFDSQGMPCAYGNEDYDNYLALQTEVFVDPNSPENDIYVLVQYRYEGRYSNDNAYEAFATWMLKYEIDDDCYRDVLLLADDWRLGPLVQEIDKEYKPEIISQSSVLTKYAGEYNLYKNLEKGENQWENDPINSKTFNYVANVDYENMAVTINYTDKKNRGKIYSYTYKVKESPNWDKALVGTLITDPMDKEYRDSLPLDKIMPSYSTKWGRMLRACYINGRWSLEPSDEQKATATLLYDFEAIFANTTNPSIQFNNYESGKIGYADVNNLTRKYIRNSESTK